MNPEQWQAVKKLFDQVIAVDPAHRSSFLEANCDGNVDLQREVASLLDSHQRASDSFLSVPTGGIFAFAAAAPSPQRRIGAYQIVEELGHGGMGEVYRAVRVDGQYDKEVAIKLVRGGFESRWLAERFWNERQILASLDHPNIARLLDGGATEDGVPYLVMELIEGVSVTQFCDTHKLGIEDRLQLFLQACSAVQYAHQHLVIHRDIKPANMLVTADGRLKLLDFGIAKMLDAGRESGTTLTSFRILTPRYASPEQIRGEPMTTASDVYSLGVVLYELLTARSPHRLTSDNPHELVSAICDREPERPSSAVSRAASPVEGSGFIAPEVVSQLRGTSIKKLQKQLKGDLDNILLMALRKEVSRRYSSVEQFAADIERHRALIPVLARRDTWNYRASKFVSRHRTMVATSGLMMLAILIALAAAIYETRVAQVQRRRAEQHFRDVRKLATSLMFDVHDQIRNLPGSTPARQFVLNRSLEYLDSLSRESGDDPNLLRELATGYERIGALEGHWGFTNLGDTKAGLASYEKALAIRQKLAASSASTSDDQIHLAASFRSIGYQELSIGDTSLAFQNIQRSVAVAEKIAPKLVNDKAFLYELGFDYEIRGHIEGGNWSAVDLGNIRAASDDYRRAVQIDDQLLAVDRSSSAQLALVNDLCYYGSTLRQLGDRDAARRLYARALAVEQSLIASEDVPSNRRMLGAVMDRIGWLAESEMKWGEALQYRQEAVKLYKAMSEADPQNVLAQQDLGDAYVSLGRVLAQRNREDESVRAMDLGVEMNRAVAAKNPGNAEQRGVLAQLLIYKGDLSASHRKFEAAIVDFQQALAIFSDLFARSPSNIHAQIDIGVCESRLGRMYARLGRYDQASAAYARAQSIFGSHDREADSMPEIAYQEAETYGGEADLYAILEGKITKPDRFPNDYAEKTSIARKHRNEAVKRITDPARVSPYMFYVLDPFGGRSSVPSQSR